MTEERMPFIDLRDKGYEFNLSNDMLDLLSQEYGAEHLIGKIKGETNIEGVGTICRQYGVDLMRRALELGEKYPERTYEVIKEASAQTGVGNFPHIAQRFLEIAYLGLLPIKALRVPVSHCSKITYAVDQCAVFELNREKNGPEIANAMPCKHLCLALLETLTGELSLPTERRADTLMASDGSCRFTIELCS